MGCFRKRSKAFTLTELLVVVLVLGVLAGVAVPKFKRVLETRKTGEAESMLAAVRTEQEHRCVMGNRYLGEDKKNKLTVLANASTSKNYTYTLTNQGAIATAKGGNYTLQIPSYKEGVVCCSGDGCSALNKNYPNCNDLVATVDECTAEGGSSGGETPEPEACVPESTTSHFDIGSGTDGSGTCYKSHKKTCDEEGNAHWTETLNYCECDNSGYTWDGSTETCVKAEKQCSGPSTQSVSISHGTCTQNRTCNTSTGNWSEWQTDESTCSCDDGYTWDGSTETCVKKKCPYQEGDQTEVYKDERIAFGYCTRKYKVCDTTTGQWDYTDDDDYDNDYSNCRCDSGYTWREASKQCVSDCAMSSSDCQGSGWGEQYGNWSIDQATCTCKCTGCTAPYDKCWVETSNGKVYGTVTYSSCNKETCGWDVLKCTTPQGNEWVYKGPVIGSKSWFEDADNGGRSGHSCSKVGDTNVYSSFTSSTSGPCGVGSGGCFFGERVECESKPPYDYTSSFEIGS
ncbi:MAG: prepilin-type N-terminal cleavage/methylation domain-containing protein [Elusimicrobiaceae bacterium]|nr:prepilin-type N-terminal cleavage/methylation domain-containing protein [Elusimicrobiaceae bacterium]